MLIDEDADPPLRSHIGGLLATCTHAEIAVGHVRLAALDLTARETQGVQHCRILLGRLEARSLMEPAGGADAHDERLRSLVHFLQSGRAHIRNAGLAAWAPDFSVYRGARGAGSTDACLVGAHYFRDPVTTDGPSFTVLLTDARSVALALARFDSLWERSHDVLEPVLGAIRRRQSFDAA